MFRFFGEIFKTLIALGALIAMVAFCSSSSNRQASTKPRSSTTSLSVETAPTWRLSRGTSQLDDSPTVYLTLKSSNQISGTYGGKDRATLTLRCVENTTAVTLNFAEHFMADHQNYGVVAYRVDKKKQRQRNFRESTDNSVLGLWSGGLAIPFIKELIGNNSLFVRAVPFNESGIEATFNIANLDGRIGVLRKACHW